jgi:predicted Zn-dependent protease
VGGLADPTASPPEVDPGAMLAACRPTAAVPLEVERAAGLATLRIFGVVAVGRRSGVGVATSTGILVSGRSTVCHLSVQACRGRARPSPAGVSVGEPADVDLERQPASVDRATRLLGAVQPASGTVTLVLAP